MLCRQAPNELLPCTTDTIFLSPAPTIPSAAERKMARLYAKSRLRSPTEYALIDPIYSGRKKWRSTKHPSMLVITTWTWVKIAAGWPG